MMNVKNMEVGLSPPYGDGILNISQNIAKLKSQRLENVHFIAMMCFCAEKNGHKFIQPALCAGRFHGMMQIMDLIKRSVVLC